MKNVNILDSYSSDLEVLAQFILRKSTGGRSAIAVKNSTLEVLCSDWPTH